MTLRILHLSSSHQVVLPCALEDRTNFSKGKGVLKAVPLIVLSLLEQTLMLVKVCREGFSTARDTNFDLGQWKDVCKSEIHDLLHIAIGQQMLRIWALTHPMQNVGSRISLISQLGYVLLWFSGVGCVKAIQDIEWLQKWYLANVSMHKQCIGKARFIGFSVTLDVFLVKIPLMKIFLSCRGDKLGIVPRRSHKTLILFNPDMQSWGAVTKELAHKDRWYSLTRAEVQCDHILSFLEINFLQKHEHNLCKQWCSDSQGDTITGDLALWVPEKVFGVFEHHSQPLWVRKVSNIVKVGAYILGRPLHSFNKELGLIVRKQTIQQTYLNTCFCLRKISNKHLFPRKIPQNSLSLLRFLTTFAPCK